MMTEQKHLLYKKLHFRLNICIYDRVKTARRLTAPKEQISALIIKCLKPPANTCLCEQKKDTAVSRRSPDFRRFAGGAL